MAGAAVCGGLVTTSFCEPQLVAFLPMIAAQVKKRAAAGGGWPAWPAARQPECPWWRPFGLQIALVVCAQRHGIQQKLAAASSLNAVRGVDVVTHLRCEATHRLRVLAGWLPIHGAQHSASAVFPAANNEAPLQACRRAMRYVRGTMYVYAAACCLDALPLTLAASTPMHAMMS